MKLRTLLLLLLTLVTAAPGLQAQSDAPRSISGVVSEAGSEELIIGASVSLFTDTISPGEKARRGAITNKFGFYSIANVEPGVYTIVIRSIGYRETTRQVTVTDDPQGMRLDVQMEVQDTKSGEVIVIGDKYKPATGTTSSVELRPGFIQQLPALGGESDIFRTLQLLPGVKSVSEISTGLYVRGGSPDQNLILLDGVVVYNPSHLGGFMSTFNSDAVRDIKLIKGAFPAEYGGRLSSVLDMTMREGTKEKISGAAGVSLINSRLTLEGPIGDDITFMASGRRMYLDLLVPLLPESEDVPQYYFYDLNAKMNYRISESDHVFLSGYFGRDVLNSPEDERDMFGIDWGNATANLRWAHIVSPTLFTNFSAIYTDYKFSTTLSDENEGSRTDVFKSVSGIRDIMLRGEAQYYPHEDHSIKSGIEVTEHRFRADVSTEIEDFGRFEGDPTIFRSLDAAVYLQDEWNITPLLSTNIGGRLYYFQSGNYLRFEPRLSLAYTLGDGVVLKGAFSTGNQFLHLVTRNDISLPTDVWFPSTATIKPSEAMQGVLGFETMLGDDEYLVSVEGYYKKMRNLLEYKDTTSFSLGAPLESSFTVGNGEAYGAELFINKRIGELTGWIGYTLAWTRRTFPDLNNGREFYPRYDRRHDISVVLVYRLGETWEFGASWVYGTGQAYTVPSGQYEFQDPETDATNDFNDQRLDYTERNGYRLPPFHKLDLNFSKSFSWFDLPWKFSINIYNAYNQRNVFAQYMDHDYSTSPTGDEGTSYKIKRVTLFPIIPTFGLSVKF